MYSVLMSFQEHFKGCDSPKTFKNNFIEALSAIISYNISGWSKQRITQRIANKSS